MSNTIYNQGENNKNVTIIIAWDYTNYSQCYGLYVYVSFEIEANYTNHVQGIKEEKISLRKVNPLLLLLSITFKGKKKTLYPAYNKDSVSLHKEGTKIKT